MTFLVSLLSTFVLRRMEQRQGLEQNNNVAKNRVWGVVKWASCGCSIVQGGQEVGVAWELKRSRTGHLSSAVSSAFSDQAPLLKRAWNFCVVVLSE